MPDPGVVPWSTAWLSLILMVSGLILALHGIGQRRPSRIAEIGGWAVVSGFLLVMLMLFVNGAVMVAKAGYAFVGHEEASPDKNDAYRQR